MRGTNLIVLCTLIFVAVFFGACANSGSTRAIDSLLLVEVGRAEQGWDLYKRVAEHRRVETPLLERAGDLMFKVGQIHMDLADNGPYARLSVAEKRQLASELAAEREAVNSALFALLVPESP